MDNIQSYAPLLELLDRPAFLVEKGIIILANRAAQQKALATGEPVTKYVKDIQAYDDFRDGCLYLTLSIGGLLAQASLTNVDRFQLFVIEDHVEPQLKALCLAAQQLRGPMNDLFLAADQMDDRKLGGVMLQRLNKLHRTVCNMADAFSFYRQQLMNPETTDLNSFIYEVIEKAATLLESSGIALNYTALPQTAVGLVDRQMLERAIFNLISNAVKFSDSKHPIEAKLTRKENTLYFTVQDSGEGIPTQVQHNLFSRYLRDPGIEDSRHGVGLGLSMVRSTALAHGGTVLVDHPEGIGTRVTLTLNLAPAQGDQLRSPVVFPGIDYAGGHDHGLLELSDVLSSTMYKK